jgi:hypothetical protein
MIWNYTPHEQYSIESWHAYQLFLSPADIIQWHKEVVLVLNQHLFMDNLVTQLFKGERIKDNVVALPAVTRKQS